MRVATHITHEAVQKIGGIGSVITGLCTADSYNTFFDETLLFGPLFNIDVPLFSRLGKDGKIYYSGLDSYASEDKYVALFKPIEEKYSVKIVYGKRRLVDEADVLRYCDVEVVLLYINTMQSVHIDTFKYQLWKHFSLSSESFKDWDYEQYVRIAIPYLDIVNALYGEESEMYHFSHEYMGMPAVLRLLVEKKENHARLQDKTVFYAHEVSTVRNIVEHHEGHDVMFYNIMKVALAQGSSVEDEFGSFSHNYRHALIREAAGLDYIFAVSDLIASEYTFLQPSVDAGKVIAVFNGIATKKITQEEKIHSRLIVQDYCENIFNFRPDFIFTHITRLVVSKGIWRDIKLLEKLDGLFYKQGIKGFYVLLSTQIGTGRPSSDVFRMESEYGWPVMHREGWPDLVGMEIDVYNSIAVFNAKSKAIKAVFINQFGFGKHECGARVPDKAHWLDLRIGSDMEIGMSIYEPFGIAQIETLPFGGIALLSSACGSSALVEKAFHDATEYYHVLDFPYLGNTTATQTYAQSFLKNMKIAQRNVHENSIIESQLSTIFTKITALLHNKDCTERLDKAYEKSYFLSWDYVVSTNIIPVLKR